MAAVDSLLKIALERRARGMVLASDKTPVLLVGEEQQSLSMPPIGHGLLEVLAQDLVSAAQREVLAQSGSVEGTYQAPGEVSFAVTLERRGEQLRVELVRSDEAVRVQADRPAVASPVTVSPVPTAPPSSVHPPDAFIAERSGEGAQGRRDASPDHVAWVRSSPWLGEVLVRAEHASASDIFLSQGRAPRVRGRRGVDALELAPTTAAQLEALVDQVLGPAQRDHLETRGSIDLSLDLRRGQGGHRYRINVFRNQNGLAVAWRPIQREVPTLGALGLPAEWTRLGEFKNGLVLIGGAAGSGKSTTACAILQHVNRTHCRHILTIEDPVEFEFEPQKSLVHQREVGTDVVDFASGIRAAMRESPDLLFVGEMRDAPTMAAALTAAETGHLVIATLHSRTAAWAVQRVVDSFPEYAQRQILTQLAGCLRAIVTQHLLDSTDGVRVPAYEIMVATQAVAQKIRENQCHQLASVIATGRGDGMIPLERSLADLVQAGRVSREQAHEVTSYPDVLEAFLSRSTAGR